MVEILIQNGTIVDGSGAAGFHGDVAIQDGKIAAVGKIPPCEAKTVIDAAGKLVTPGFIDIHRHADAAALRQDFGKLELRQGLTTIINGNCGLSVAPCDGVYRKQVQAYLSPVTGEIPENLETASMGAYLCQLKNTPLRIHTGMLVGLGTVRASVAGYETLHLSPKQMKKTQTMLERALSGGALGVSLGLGYAPECFFETKELIEALQPLAGSNIPITVHMRQEGSGVEDALAEMITVAKALHTPVEISHLKSIGKANWGKSTPKMLTMMERARQEGIDIACDCYPYTAGSTQLIHVLPPECQQGGLEQLSEHLKEPAFRAKLRKRMETGDDFENITKLVGWENVVVTSLNLPENQYCIGKSIAALAEEANKDPYDFAFDLLAAERCKVTMIDFIVSEDDIDAILRDRHSCVISDSTYPTSGMLHPRVYGTYARVVEHFVRERGVLSVEQAVEKITSRPAKRLGLKGKGLLAPGMDADINVFDLASVHECGTYENPAQFASGFDWVIVGGKMAVARESFTEQFVGTVL